LNIYKQRSFQDLTIDIRSTVTAFRLKYAIDALVGNNRFTDIQESIRRITPKVLAKELKDLEQQRVITGTVIDGCPVKVTYQLSEYADTLAPLIYSLKDRGLKTPEESDGTGIIVD
jgi:DNA-binding HxlR family transcriptional regulator